MSDLISRQVAVNELIAMREHLSGMSIIGMEAYNMAIECLQEPERPKWHNKSETGFICSVCSFGDFDGFHGYKPNYCPNCGAKAEVEE